MNSYNKSINVIKYEVSCVQSAASPQLQIIIITPVQPTANPGAT